MYREDNSIPVRYIYCLFQVLCYLIWTKKNTHDQECVRPIFSLRPLIIYFWITQLFFSTAFYPAGHFPKDVLILSIPRTQESNHWRDFDRRHFLHCWQIWSIEILESEYVLLSWKNGKWMYERRCKYYKSHPSVWGSVVPSTSRWPAFERISFVCIRNCC